MSIESSIESEIINFNGGKEGEGRKKRKQGDWKDRGHLLALHATKPRFDPRFDPCGPPSLPEVTPKEKRGITLHPSKKRKEKGNTTRHTMYL